jgi:hypothetical protein
MPIACMIVHDETGSFYSSGLSPETNLLKTVS